MNIQRRVFEEQKKLKRKYSLFLYQHIIHAFLLSQTLCHFNSLFLQAGTQAKPFDSTFSVPSFAFEHDDVVHLDRA
jgi:hypothetical protein